MAPKATLAEIKEAIEQVRQRATDEIQRAKATLEPGPKQGAVPHGDDVERRNEATSLMTALTSAAPSCNCFGWCSVLQVERFFAALPAVVTSASSN